MHTEFGDEGKTLNSNDISKARLNYPDLLYDLSKFY